MHESARERFAIAQAKRSVEKRSMVRIGRKRIGGRSDELWRHPVDRCTALHRRYSAVREDGSVTRCGPRSRRIEPVVDVAGVGGVQGGELGDEVQAAGALRGNALLGMFCINREQSCWPARASATTM